MLRSTRLGIASLAVTIISGLLTSMLASKELEATIKEELDAREKNEETKTENTEEA